MELTSLGSYWSAESKAAILVLKTAFFVSLQPAATVDGPIERLCAPIATIAVHHHVVVAVRDPIAVAILEITIFF